MNSYWGNVKENLYARAYGLPPVQQMPYTFTENNMANGRAHVRRNTYARSKNSYFSKGQRHLEGVEPSPAPIVSYNSNNSTSSAATLKKEMSPVEAERARHRAERRAKMSPNRAERVKAMRNALTVKMAKGGRRHRTTRGRRHRA